MYAGGNGHVSTDNGSRVRESMAGIVVSRRGRCQATDQEECLSSAGVPVSENGRAAQSVSTCRIRGDGLGRSGEICFRGVEVRGGNDVNKTTRSKTQNRVYAPGHNPASTATRIGPGGKPPPKRDPGPEPPE